MSYLSVPFRVCLLLLPLISLVAGPEPVRAEDKLAVSFELPPAKALAHPLVRHQDKLPPIVPLQSAASETIANKITANKTIANKTIAKSIAAINVPDKLATAFSVGSSEGTNLESALLEDGSLQDQPSRGKASESEQMALQFAQNDIAIPAAGSQPQKKIAGTVPEAFALNSTTEDLLATSGLWIYEGGSDSLVARTVGSAEGTRYSSGERTTAYYGHIDPGNGVWNLGTFSYQHEASSPEDADEKQLKRLQRQELQLKEKAAKWNVPLSIEVRLNGLDLANQAPIAALDKGGYIERLAEAYSSGKSGEAAIVWARTHAYFDPDKQAWDAPGLGNSRYSIQRDQERRIAAINSALRRYTDEQTGQIDSLSRSSVASVSTASNHPLLAQTHSLVQTDSMTMVDFSLEPVSFSVPALTNSKTPAKALIAKKADETILLESAYRPIEHSPVEHSPVDHSPVDHSSDEVSEALGNDSQFSKGIVPESIVPEGLVLENRVSEELASKDWVSEELIFEDDAIAAIASDEWDERYEAIASETTALIETEAVALEGSLTFEKTEMADLANTLSRATQATDTPATDLYVEKHHPQNQLQSEAVENAVEPALQNKESAQHQLSRILEGAEASERVRLSSSKLRTVFENPSERDRP